MNRVGFRVLLALISSTLVSAGILTNRANAMSYGRDTSATDAQSLSRAGPEGTPQGIVESPSDSDEDGLFAALGKAMNVAPNGDVMTEGMKNLLDSAEDEWSQNMESALTAFMRARGEVKRGALERSRVESRLLCRIKGCVIQLVERNVPEGKSFVALEDIRAGLKASPWMVQLRPVYEFAVKYRGDLYYAHLFQRVELMELSGSEEEVDRRIPNK